MLRTSLRKISRIGLLLGVAAAASAAQAACVGDGPAATAPATEDAGPDASSAAVCNSYCQSVMSNCKDANSQYASSAECQQMCALLPVGQDGVTEDSVQCRLARAKVAGSKDTCLAAGPFGGDVCGTRCQAFCALVVGNCGTTGAAPYPSAATCQEDCATLKFDPALPEGPTQPLDGDTLNCRGMHLRLSLTDKVMHCPHTGLLSSVCAPIADAGNGG